MHPELVNKVVWIHPTISSSNSYGGHGIQVAGVAGAETNNSDGITSLGWNTSLMLAQRHNYPAIAQLTDNGADIINFSWIIKNPGTVSNPTSLQNVIKYALQNGVILTGFWSVDPMASKFPSWSEQRTQTRRTWFGLGPEKTTTYYTVTVDGESDFNWAQDDYASALFDAIVSEDVVFNVFYQETAQVGNIRNADLQGAGGGIYRIVSSREANIYVDPRGYQRVGDPSSIILMHEMIGHNHPVGTPPPGRLNNAHDINRFYHQKLGIQPKAGYRNPHRGYKGEIQWPRTGYYRR